MIFNLLFHLFFCIYFYIVSIFAVFLFIIFQFFSWAILILSNIFVVVVLYCVQFFFGSKKIPKSLSPFLFLSFANTFLFLFISSILFEFSKCLISQNIGCHIKTQFKNSTQTIFQGSSPWATLILNSVFVVVVLYCVQFFFGSKMFPKSFSPFLFRSFAIAFVSYLVQFSRHPLLGFYGVSMGFWPKFLWKFYVISMLFLWYSIVCLKVCLW